MNATRLPDPPAAATGVAGSAGWDLGAMYRVIAELLLNPAVRDTGRLERDLGALTATPVRDCIERFLANPASQNVDEYTQTLELTPPCPLYLGAHMYDEPNSCRGAGACGRNQYMIEIKASYQHFGVELDGLELPDFLPVMVEFMAYSLAHPERDGIGLRRRFVEHYLQPGLPHLRKALQKYESVYDLLLEALQIAVDEDCERLVDEPVWLAPEVRATIPVRAGTTAAPAGVSPQASMNGWAHP